jgi:hypothetical protein
LSRRRAQPRAGGENPAASWCAAGSAGFDSPVHSTAQHGAQVTGHGTRLTTTCRSAATRAGKGNSTCRSGSRSKPSSDADSGLPVAAVPHAGEYESFLLSRYIVLSPRASMSFVLGAVSRRVWLSPTRWREKRAVAPRSHPAAAAPERLRERRDRERHVDLHHPVQVTDVEPELQGGRGHDHAVTSLSERRLRRPTLMQRERVDQVRGAGLVWSRRALRPCSTHA